MKIRLTRWKGSNEISVIGTELKLSKTRKLFRQCMSGNTNRTQCGSIHTCLDVGSNYLSTNAGKRKSSQMDAGQALDDPYIYQVFLLKASKSILPQYNSHHKGKLLVMTNTTT